MIVSNISGIRLLPLYKADLNYIKRMYADSPSWVFSDAPGFEAISEIVAAPVVHLINFDTGVESVETVNQSDVNHRGTAYKINSVSSREPISNNGTRRYYYRVVFGTSTYYSPIFEITCEANFKISYAHTCTSVLTGSDSFINKLQIKEAVIVPDGVAGTQNGLELSDGSLKITNSHTRTVWRLEIVGSRDLYERLQHIRQFDTVTVTAFGTAYPVKANTFKIEGNQPTARTSVIVATFQVDAVDEIVNCYCPGFEDSGEVGNGNGGSSDVACPNLTVAIDSTSLPTLTANIGGTPSTPRSVKWYKDGVFFSTAESVQVPNEDANWELRVKVDSCLEKTATYTYVNECNLFKIIHTLTGSTLNANFEDVPNGQTVSAVVKDEGGATVSSSLPYTPTASGVYTIEATAGTCVKTKAVNIILNSDACTHTVEIQRAGDQLQGIVNDAPSGTTTYLWQLIDDQNTIGTIATTQNITPTQTGIYIFKATIGGCTVESEGYLFVSHSRVEIINPITVISDSRWRYELFTINTGSSNNFDDSSNSVVVTRGTLPDVTGLTDQQINEKIVVHINQNLLSHKNPTTFVSEFAINNSTNTLTVHKNLDQWDVLSVFFLEDLQ